MIKSEALELLEKAQCDDTPSEINPGITKAQCVKIVRDGIRAYYDVSSRNDYTPLSDILEKRVWQAVKNQKRPKYSL